MTQLANIGLNHYLIVGLFLFAIGIFGITITKNLIRILLSLEVMFCGITLNFAAFSVYCDTTHFKGAIFSLFIIILSILHIVICIAVIIEAYKTKQSSDIEDFGELKG
ncbi:MAG: NADH-quinone oxidoreductase subunit NuoK [Candidatus Gastranaerophilaceae bacterium]